MSSSPSGAYPTIKRRRGRAMPQSAKPSRVPAIDHQDAMSHASWVAATYHFVHRRFIWLLVGSYAVAAVWPGPGLAIRNVVFGKAVIGHEASSLSLPMLMLAFLLFNAGLDVKTAEMRHILRRPTALLSGLAGNIFVPIAFIFLAAQLLRFWSNFDEAQQIVLGLALVAAMPIAGSSTAWAQNANGDIALSLGLVLFSTFISPLTTPLTLNAVKHMANGEYAATLDRLEIGGTSFFLLVCVLLPSLIGIAVRYAVGSRRIDQMKPTIKLVNCTNLLLLNYSNAAISLPQILNRPDWDWLAVVLLVACLLCITAFASGWFVARLVKGTPREQISLMFGLGMNNNGTALVLASLTVAQYPRALVPIISYNLIQHLVAGAADFFVQRRLASVVDED